MPWQAVAGNGRPPHGAGTMAPSMRRPVATSLVLAVTLVAACVLPQAHPPTMTFDEAGLVRPRAAAPERARTRLEGATDALLAAIERGTGERPAFDADRDDAPDLDPGERREARRRAAGWAAERADLSMELLRALDTGEATVRTVKRARSALLWDLLLGARWTQVDSRLVHDALARAEAALPAPPAPASAGAWAATLAWPVSPVRVTSRFGIRSDPFGEGARRHAGIDLVASEGQPVTAAAAGDVVYAGLRGGYGLHVELRHPDGRLTRYAHLRALEVREGDRIVGGTLVGLAGHSGRATGPHLHFEVWKDGLPVDPEEELESVTLLGDGAGPRPPRLSHR